MHCHHNILSHTDLVDFESLSDKSLLYGDSWCDDNQNNSTLSASIYYIKKTKLKTKREKRNIFHPEGLKLLTCFPLGFSHLNEHHFWHNFQECLNPLCMCSLETENTSQYLLHCHYHTLFYTDLVDFESLSDCKKVEILLYGDSRCNDNQSNSILSASINYIKKTKCFDCSLFD